MTMKQAYLVDSDVFITAKNLYYAFDICPGFWKSVLHFHQLGRIFSIDKVRNELLAGHAAEDLVQWAKNDAPQEFFLPVGTDAVVGAFAEIMIWVQNHPKYFDHAKAKFAAGADGWLIACARTHGSIVVSNEQSAPDARKEVKLPDVCDHFGVRHDNTFSMLRSLKIQYGWAELG